MNTFERFKDSEILIDSENQINCQSVLYQKTLELLFLIFFGHNILENNKLDIVENFLSSFDR